MTEINNSPEREIRNHEIAITTSISCPNWYEGEVKNPRDVDKIRGDLSLDTLRAAKNKGFQVIPVLDSRSTAFKEIISKEGFPIYEESEPSLSAARRDATKIASEIPGVKAMLTIEPEKVSMVDFAEKLTDPVLNDEADIVVPARDEEAFNTYPPFQKNEELQANRIANEVLHEAGLLGEGEDNLDLWVGTRAFRNDPKIIELFMTKTHYRFSDRTREILEKKGIDMKTFNTESWADFQFIPVIKALNKGYRVKSIPVAYRHPASQTQNEIGDIAFDKKRQLQLKNVILAIVQEVKALDGESRDSGIKLVEE